MKLSALFIFSSLCMLQANTSYSQKTKISLDLDNATVERLIDEIESKTEFRFVYMLNDVDMDRLISVKANKEKVSSILTRVFGKSKTSFSVIDRQIYLTKKKIDMVPKEVIVTDVPVDVTGKVSDENGLPLTGVTVRIAGTNTGVATDFDGNYTITAPSAESVLIFSFLGFATKEITVGNQTTIDVTMQEAVNELDEVVLNAGYYNVSERTKTGSISKITSKTIEKQPVNNPLAAMQGHIPGVNITQTTGLPGGGFNIEIRGQNSIASGTEPFFIIDGVPYGSETLGSTFVSSVLRGNISPLNAINPADIESIEVLKDADATAIYGSRGANGVVLITTKKGKIGKTQVKVNASTTLGQVTRMLDLMNTEQYLEMRNEAYANDGRNITGSAARDLLLWDQNRNTDWQKELIGGTMYRNNAQLSLSGGSAQTQFLISSGYLNETTVFPGDANYDKLSVLSNINHRSADTRFKVNLSVNYVAEDNQLPGTDFTSIATTLPPNAPALYDSLGNLNFEDRFDNNPLAILNTEVGVQTYNLIANSSLSYQLLPSLELKTNLGYNDIRLESYRALPHTRFTPISSQFDPSRSSISINNTTRRSWIVEPQVNWQKRRGDAHLSVLVGATFQQQTSQQLVQQGIGFSSNILIFDLSAANTTSIVADEESEYNYNAFFGRINFNWKDKYILNLTGRRDGSSRFGPRRQFGDFGAIGAAWVFSEERLLKDNNLLSFGKLRTSYGITGSDNVGNYRFLDTYSTTSNNYDGVSGLNPTGLFNPNFGWEENQKLEAALELGFWKDRIFLSTSYYRNRSSNQLVGIPLPTTTGFTTLTANFDATVENTGWEVDFRSINIQKENFSWSTTFNISANKNKLVKYDDLEGSPFANTLVIGEPLNIRKLFHVTGVDPDTGVYQFEDFNDDGAISALEDRQRLADLTPKFYGGLGNTISYRNLQLDFFFQFKKQKGQNYIASSSLPGGRRNQRISVLDRWQEVGDEGPVQRYTTGRNRDARTAFSNYQGSDASITDASFIRLRNVSLSYTLPKDVMGSADINIYLQGQNLITITDFDGFDPEQAVQQSLPPLQQLTLGLNVSF